MNSLLSNDTTDQSRPTTYQVESKTGKNRITLANSNKKMSIMLSYNWHFMKH